MGVFYISFLSFFSSRGQIDTYADKTNELLKTRKELKRISKQMSSENANIRKLIKNNSCDLEFIEKLAKTEQQMKLDYQNRGVER